MPSPYIPLLSVIHPSDYTKILLWGYSWYNMKWLGDKSSSVHSQRNTKRQWGRWGEPKQYPAPSTSRATTGAINPGMSHLNKSREAQGHNGRWESSIRTSKKQTPCWTPFRAAPEDPPSLSPRHWNEILDRN